MSFRETDARESGVGHGAWIHEESQPSADNIRVVHPV